MKTGLFPLLAILLLLLACQDQPRNGLAEQNKSALVVSPLHQYFVRSYPDKPALVWAFHDVNNDGRDDLILIYRLDRERNAMRVILGTGGTYTITNDVPAPISSQTIAFKDIDDKPPMEFIVQGMKGTNMGYAVYRIENSKLVDLFSEGMAGCCG
ncbi:MAG: hypothetical protein A4E58_00358 [Syntrophorhabdus sp. PtaB.Bin006]|nr:MAG: hypothetical protein A4E58_00358 [Syntrophorhabdus sp. PtaB.Bin006]